MSFEDFVNEVSETLNNASQETALEDLMIDDSYNDFKLPKIG